MIKTSQLKALDPKKVTPKIGGAVDDCLIILLNEIKLATTWSRPSILLAVHRSKIYREQAIFAMEQKLAELSIEVVHIIPSRDQLDILNVIKQKPNPNRTIFFIQGLGDRNEIYAGLNFHREIIVENQIKLIFWLTTEECTSISRRAPDFWAFRHRVIEFPSKRSFPRRLLPAGALLWHEKNLFQELETIGQNIVSQENIVKNLPNHDEAATSHINVTGNLAYLYWLTGKNHKAEELFRQELEKANQYHLNDMKSFLLNGQAISCYDRGAYHEAFALIEDALVNRPDDGILWANHGIMCRATGQSNKSLASVKRALRIKPSASEFWGVMGYIYMSTGKFDTALSPFEKALSIDPENIQFMFASAVCFSQIGNYDRFAETMKLISANILEENSYYTICRDYLQGNKPAALNQLKGMLKSGKIPRSLLNRDPSLHFILGIDALLSIT
jgi:tetratricopeptide (TPR) repeat protein